MMTITPYKKKKIGLVCSSGGHFLELYSTDRLWRQYPHFWITFHGGDTECLLKNRKVYRAYSPTTRNVKNFFKNFYLAIKVLRNEKPDVIVSTGAGVSVPFLIVGKFFGSKIIFIESLTLIDRLSLSGKLVYHFADIFLVQWPQLASKYKKAQYKGQLV